VWVWSCKKRNRGGQRRELDGEEKIEKAVHGREDQPKKKKKKIINASLKLSIISKRYIILFDPSIGVMRRHKKFVP